MANIRPLSVELSKKAQEELNEVPERITEDIAALKTWISKQAHLKARTDDQFLVNFLRGSKYSLERAKQKLDLYFTVRNLMPELFLNRDPTDRTLLEIIRLGCFVVLPKGKTPDSPLTLIYRPGAHDPSKYNIIDIMKVSTMTMDILMRDSDQYIIGGHCGLMDLSNAGMSHFLQFNPTFVKKMTTLSQDASPLRQKGLHYIHTPSGFETIFNFFKGFMNEKNQKRLYVHGENMEELYKHISKSLLPTEYGGDAGPFKNFIDDWEKILIANKDYFKEDENYGTDERKRIGEPKNAENLFGVDGSFRKLDVF